MVDLLDCQELMVGGHGLFVHVHQIQSAALLQVSRLVLLPFPLPIPVLSAGLLYFAKEERPIDSDILHIFVPE